MPIEQSLWTISSGLTKPLSTCTLDSEIHLEDLIVDNPRLLHDGWLLIGRQVLTAHGKYIDLLAVDCDGSIIIIELKKHKTPRDVVAQCIDYASWVQGLSSDVISDIYRQYTDGGNLSQDFRDCFQLELDDDQLNQSHQMVIVASELDASSERIVRYLNQTAGIPLSVLFFRVFQHGCERLLSRAWLLEPQDASSAAPIPSKSKTGGTREAWNGEFFIRFDTRNECGARNWTNAQQFNFISGGGRPWFSKTLFQLRVGDRVWVNIPGTGYVGVGKVTAEAVRADAFQCADGQRLIDHPDLSGDWSDQPEKSDDSAEYILAIDWIYCVPEGEAAQEVGFFENGNTVAKPANSKWIHTVDRLKKLWGVS